MRKAYLASGMVLACLAASSQTTMSDSVLLGANSSNMVFYSLSSGTRQSGSAQDWDLQFGTNFMSASIRINDGISNAANVALYKLQNSDTANWGYPADTSAMTRLFNSDTTWETGAFNNQQLPCLNPAYNFGWGCYDGSTHHVTGSEIFVIKTIGGSYKQIWVRLLNGTTNTYEIRLADLNGSNARTVFISRNPYSGKSSFYYAIEADQIKDIEPQKTDWDLVFRRYETYVAFPPPAQFYTVTGVLLNAGVTAAEARNVSTASNDYSAYTFESNISVIGYDWKAGQPAAIVDSLAYFVHARDGYIYKLVFTGYSGLSSGKIFFNKTQVASATSVSEAANIRQLAVYPNPSADNVQALFTLRQEGAVTVTVHDLSGKSHLVTRMQTLPGLNVLTLHTADLSPGFYLLSVDDGSTKLTYKFVRN